MNIRMTGELESLIWNAAERSGLDFSDVVRRCVRSMKSRNVVSLSNDKSYYKSGDIVKRIPGIDFDGDANILRGHIADRCKDLLGSKHPVPIQAENTLYIMDGEPVPDSIVKEVLHAE